jgi:hypothetical protein
VCTIGEAVDAFLFHLLLRSLTMDWRELIASLVDALAWPASVAIIMFVLRRQIGALAEGRLRRVKAGPVELEFWETAAVEVAQSVAVALPPISKEEDAEIHRLMVLADSAPIAAILESFGLIERELRAIVSRSNLPAPRTVPVPVIADKLVAAGAITPESATAIRGLGTLRNMAAHGRDFHPPGASRAREYVVLTTAILFALRHKRTPSSTTT